MTKYKWRRIPLVPGTEEAGSYPPARPIFKWIVGLVVLAGLIYIFFLSKPM